MHGDANSGYSQEACKGVILVDYMVDVEFARQKLKCNINGTSRGNPCLSSYGFCLRIDGGDLISVKVKGIGMAMNTEAESMDIQDALEYCQEKNLNEVTIETNSLVVRNIIQRQWIIPWEITERVEKIIMIMQLLDACMVHTFREDNTLADALANQVVESQGTEMYMDKAQVPTS
ncbi:uncharacterized protein LOC125811346 [Solanum verrucosum]|uniref:uncharacterized protein LOC125811346 n=1 Tax=Solanum verrucosum TaxID=315347 RepID=UPI0020D13ACD|nr:uncharacterized protein LOC125811346 [Solanum verrucosum]